MKKRLRNFGLHLAASATILGLVLGGLFLGWYRWPGWYLALVTPVVAVMAGVDVALGPILTLIVSSPAKAPRTLARDVAVIVAVQLLALGYGSAQLWNGRPLYYVLSGGILQMVQAYDIDPDDAARARAAEAPLAPHWYSLPRWVYAPVPAVPPAPGSPPIDYSTMPTDYQPPDAGSGELRAHLQPVAAQRYFIFNERGRLQERMQAAGLATGAANTLPMTGRGRPVLVVFDPATLRVLAILKGT
jgi:hypothetical protein